MTSRPSMNQEVAGQLQVRYAHCQYCRMLGQRRFYVDVTQYEYRKTRRPGDGRWTSTRVPSHDAGELANGFRRRCRGSSRRRRRRRRRCELKPESGVQVTTEWRSSLYFHGVSVHRSLTGRPPARPTDRPTGWLAGWNFATAELDAAIDSSIPTGGIGSQLAPSCALPPPVRRVHGLSKSSWT